MRTEEGKTFLRKRKWLNPKKSTNTGALDYSVYSDTEDYGGYGCVEAHLSIWDCNRKITIDFSMYYKEDGEKIARKINILIDSLTEIKEALGVAWEEKLNG